MPGGSGVPGGPGLPPTEAKPTPLGGDAAGPPGGGAGPAADFKGEGQEYVRFLEKNPAAEVEAAVKKLREQPHDKQALEELERTVQRFKESVPTPATPATPAAK